MDPCEFHSFAMNEIKVQMKITIMKYQKRITMDKRMNFSSPTHMHMFNIIQNLNHYVTLSVITHNDGKWEQKSTIVIYVNSTHTQELKHNKKINNKNNNKNVGKYETLPVDLEK